MCTAAVHSWPLGDRLRATQGRHSVEVHKAKKNIAHLQNTVITYSIELRMKDEPC